MAAGHTDPDLFGWVTNGVEGTAMPPFGQTLSEEDRWHVINYIRQFANAAAEQSSPTTTSPAATTEPGPSPSPMAAAATSSPSPTAIGVEPSPSPLALSSPEPLAETSVTPRDAWRAVGHWQNLGLITTQEFTVHGPWRIRWQLQSTEERCYIMIEEDVTKPPLLLSGDPGATAGIFQQDRPGTYRLMLHNTTPYDVVVEETNEQQGG